MYSDRTLPLALARAAVFVAVLPFLPSQSILGFLLFAGAAGVCGLLVAAILILSRPGGWDDLKELFPNTQKGDEPEIFVEKPFSSEERFRSQLILMFHPSVGRYPDREVRSQVYAALSPLFFAQTFDHFKALDIMMKLSLPQEQLDQMAMILRGLKAD